MYKKLDRMLEQRLTQERKDQEVFKSWCEDTIYGLEFRLEKQRLELQKEILDTMYNTQKTILQQNNKSCEILNDIARTSHAAGDLESIINKYQSPHSSQSKDKNGEANGFIKPFTSNKDMPKE